MGFLTKAKEPSQTYNLPTPVGKTDGFMPFPRVLVWSETQKELSRIWTLVTNSISNNNKRTSNKFQMVNITSIYTSLYSNKNNTLNV